MSDSKDLLRAPFELAYNYKRSSGAVMSKFFEALGQQKILGTKSRAGKVFSPAAEFDPQTHESLKEMVEVGPGGSVESYSWIEAPQNHHVITAPFAFALIKLEGDDSTMLHMIADCNEADLSIGTRVTAAWSETSDKRITDIKFFTLEK